MQTDVKFKRNVIFAIVRLKEEKRTTKCKLDATLNLKFQSINFEHNQELEMQLPMGSQFKFYFNI